MNEFVVEAEYEGERLDKVLPQVIDGYSRSYLTSLLKDGEVLLNGVRVRPSAKVKEGDHVFFSIPEKIVPDILPEDIPLDILYEDSDVLVVNKPKGMVVHPATGHYTGTLVNAVLYHCGDSLSGINGVLRPGIVHRIDRDTTGSVIVCKNDAAHRSIAQQLKDHTIVRRYLAICRGILKDDDCTIDEPLARDPKDRKKMAVVPGGKRAVTHVHVLTRFRDATYIECRLETGRTHQIRVHLAHLGHPLLGDTVYGGAKNNPGHLQGQCLHAYILGFVHPTTGEYIETKAPIPAYFQHLLDTLPEA